MSIKGNASLPPAEASSPPAVVPRERDHIRRHFITLDGLPDEAVLDLTSRCLEFAQGARSSALGGRSVGLYFAKPSTRTRTAFNVAVAHLGGNAVSYGPSDLQIVTGETRGDTATVLACYLDALVVRTDGPQSELVEMACQRQMSIVNALTREEHPTQAIGDLATVREVFGALDGLHLVYIGDGNNTAAALTLAAAQVRGLGLTMVSPEDFALPQALRERAAAMASRTGAIVSFVSIEGLPRDADVVYTTRWEAMGVRKTVPNWLDVFRPYKVTQSLFTRVAASPRTIFMHDLPATRGQEVENAVLDGPASLVTRQAYHKLTGAAAILEWCEGGDSSR